MDTNVHYVITSPNTSYEGPAFINKEQYYINCANTFGREAFEDKCHTSSISFYLDRVNTTDSENFFDTFIPSPLVVKAYPIVYGLPPRLLYYYYRFTDPSFGGTSGIRSNPCFLK